MNSLVLFDFDKTIISQDTGYAFILFSLQKSFLRKVFALLFSPFALVLFLSQKTRFIGNSIYLWISTAGLSLRQLRILRTNFIAHYLSSPKVCVYNDALMRIKTHINQGDQVVVISGASKWMLDAIFEQTQLPKIMILGSDENRLLGGMVSSFHCFGQNKVKVLEKKVNLQSYSSVVGYSDSSSDIPLLSLCHIKYLVNPSKRSLSCCKKTFKKDIQVLNWT